MTAPDVCGRVSGCARALGLACVVAAVACVGGQPEGGALGKEGAVRFRGETDLVFSATLVVGSTFTITAEEANDEVDLDGAKLVSADGDVLVVEDSALTHGAVRIADKGTGRLRVQRDGETVDEIVLKGAEPAATSLVDGALFNATDQVDARLPKSFALLSGSAASVLVAAVDVCGGDLLDLHASTLTVEGAQASVTATGPAAFALEPAEKGALSVTLVTPGLKDLVYDVTVVVADDVDEVHATVASASENTANVWGRAFADEIDVVGALEFSFTSSERVGLSNVTGLAVVCEIIFPESGEAPDERPANLTAELFGHEDTIDFLTLTTDQIVQTRGEPARAAPEPKQPTPSCSDTSGSATDACAAAGALYGLRSLRRLRKRLADEALLDQPGVDPPRRDHRRLDQRRPVGRPGAAP